MLADYLPQLLLAWSIQIMGVISPGPGVMLVVGVAASSGRLPAVTTAFGIACGSVILATATVFGLTALLSQTADLMTVIRFAAAAYLAWLAWRSFRTAVAAPKLKPANVTRASLSRNWITGFALQITNPKAIFFWLAIASVGGAGTAPWPVLVLFVAGAFVNSLVGHGAYGVLLSAAPVRRAYEKFRSWIEATLGCFFLFAGFKLLTAK